MTVSAITSKNAFLTDVSRGKFGDCRALVVEGHNPSFDTADGEMDLWGAGVNLTYLSAAETLNCVSDDANDANGDTGAHSLFIVGLDAEFSRVTDLVLLNGTTPVESSNAFYRVDSLFVLAAGSSLTNEGTITCTASSAATIQAEMDPSYSVAEEGFHTLYKGTKTIIKQVEIASTKAGGGQDPVVNFRVYIRAPGANQPWFIVLERKLDTAVQNQLVVPFPLSNRQIEGADIRFTASTTQNDTEARVRMILLEWDD